MWSVVQSRLSVIPGVFTKVYATLENNTLGVFFEPRQITIGLVGAGRCYPGLVAVVGDSKMNASNPKDSRSGCIPTATHSFQKSSLLCVEVLHRKGF